MGVAACRQSPSHPQTHTLAARQAVHTPTLSPHSPLPPTPTHSCVCTDSLQHTSQPHLIVLILLAEPDEVHLHQQLLQHAVVDAGNGLPVGGDERLLGVRHGDGLPGCVCVLGVCVGVGGCVCFRRGKHSTQPATPTRVRSPALHATTQSPYSAHGGGGSPGDLWGPVFERTNTHFTSLPSWLSTSGRACSSQLQCVPVCLKL